MGTHMSAYIEIDRGNRLPPFSDPQQIFSLCRCWRRRTEQIGCDSWFGSA